MSLWLAVIFSVECYGLDSIAHRGLSSSIQENTIDAIQGAWKAGADIVELDVRILSDHTLVLFHDDNIEGRRIDSLTYDIIQSLTPDYHIPTLREAFDACSPEQSLLLDLKDSSKEFIDCLLAELTANSGRGPRLLLQSSVIDVLNALKYNLQTPTLLFVTSLNRNGLLMRIPDPKKLSLWLKDNQLAGVTAKGRGFIDREFVRSFQEKDLLFYVWTINSSDRISYYRDIGVDGIISDYPELVPVDAVIEKSEQGNG
jgi:glycerophosphoryl diester phosphodiesterase